MPNPPNHGEFQTPSGKALFVASPLEKTEVSPGRLLMTTIRSHDQFNTTVYDLNDRYRGVHGSRRVILMNEKNIADLGLEAGQQVDITSHWEDGEREIRNFTVVRYPIAVDCCATYFPEANPLVPLGSIAKRSFTPTSKCVIVSVRAAER
jgi:anaerobic selenocysteine-containing dehydrogenase